MNIPHTREKHLVKGSKVIYQAGFCAFYIVARIYFEDGICYCDLRNPSGQITAKKVAAQGLLLFGEGNTFYEVLLHELDRSFAWCESVAYHYTKGHDNQTAYINTVAGAVEAKYAFVGPFSDAERLLIAFTYFVYGAPKVKDIYDSWQARIKAMETP